MAPDEDESIRQQIRETPADVDLDHLCAVISGEVDTDRSWPELKGDLIEATDDAAADELARRCFARLGDDPESGGLRRIVRKLSRWHPRVLAPLLAEYVPGGTPEQRGVALLGLDTIAERCPAVVAPHAKLITDQIERPDPRYGAAAVGILAKIAGTYPAAATNGAEPARRFLATTWYDPARDPTSIFERNAPDEGYDPPLTVGTVPKSPPMREMLRLYTHLARPYPEIVAPTVEQLVTLVETIDPDVIPGELFKILSTLAQTRPMALDPALPTLESLAERDPPKRCVTQAQNVLCELGRAITLGEGVPVGEFQPRTVETDESDRDHANDIEMIGADGEDPDELLRLLHSTDERVRDLTASGLEHAPHDFLQPMVHGRAGEFLALLDEPHQCTRNHLVIMVGRVASRRYRTWLPTLLDLAEHDRPEVRRGALEVIEKVALSAPCPVENHVGTMIARVNDPDPDVRAATLEVLVRLVKAHPDRHVEHVPAVASCLDDDESVQLAACTWLSALAKHEPTVVEPVVEKVQGLLEARLRPGRIHERETWERGHLEGLTVDDKIVDAAARTLFHVARSTPEVIDPVRSELEAGVDRRVNGWEAALNALHA